MFLTGRVSNLLLLSLASSVAARTDDIVLNLNYQSKGIGFSDWVSLFTLCLTPLLAHIIAGTPAIVYLSHTKSNLTWHQRFCQYNPTTILWRYFSIADRRFRAKAWSAADMAASNALFWTPRGWDGSEEMIERSQAHCLRLPTSSRANILSKSFFKTLVVTIQGLQAIINLLKGLKPNDSSTVVNIALDQIFFPLAVLGLLRLCAAPWVTEDYLYHEHEDRQIGPAARQRSASSKTVSYPFGAQTASSTELLEYIESPILESRFHPVNSWRGRLFRVFFLIPILLLWILCLGYMLPMLRVHVQVRTTTILLLDIFYLVFLSATILIYTYYFIRGRSETTIIPCIVSTWYQIYTCILILMMIVLVTVAALETRKTVCGMYTTWPISLTYNDAAICRGMYLNPNTEVFGIATRSVAPLNTTLLPQDEYRIVGLDGWCIGTQGVSQYVVAVNNSSQII